MNILIISHEYPPDTSGGGISTYYKTLAEELANRGNNITVLAYSKYRRGVTFEDGIKIIRVKFPFIYKLYPLLILNKIKQIVKEDKIEIIETPEYCAEAVLYQIIRKVPIVTRIHGSLLVYLVKKENNLATLSDEVINKLEKFQTRNSDGISCISNFLAKLSKKEWKINRKRIKVINNGIKKCTNNNTLSNNEGYILFYGKLDIIKGVLVFISALKDVFAKHPNQKVVFLGQNLRYNKYTMKDFILQELEDYRKNIVFAGFVSGDKKIDIIKKAKVVITPSLKEGFGYTALESMALGKVVIATKGNGFEDFIKNNYSGFLVNPGSSFELSNKINECLKKRNFESIEKRAKRKAKEFEINRIAKSTLKLYNEVILKFRRKKDG